MSSSALKILTKREEKASLRWLFRQKPKLKAREREEKPTKCVKGTQKRLRRSKAGKLDESNKVKKTNKIRETIVSENGAQGQTVYSTVGPGERTMDCCK